MKAEMTPEEKLAFLRTIFTDDEIAALIESSTDDQIDDLIARLVKYGTNA